MHYFDDIFDNTFLIEAAFMNLFDILLKIIKANNLNIFRKWRSYYFIYKILV